MLDLAEDGILEFEGSVLDPTLPPISPSKGEAELEINPAALTTLLFRPDEAPVEFNLSELKEIVAHDENFAWLDLSNYGENDLRGLARLLGLHPLALRAALLPWQRPRFDNYHTRNHFFVTVTVAHLKSPNKQVLVGELDLFIGPNFLLSTHKLPLPFAKKVLERAIQSPELLRLDAAFMLYLILDELLEYYEELSDHIEVENEKMEQRALKDTSDQFLADLLQHKRYVFALDRLADQHRRVFSALLRPDNSLSSAEETLNYFQDLQSHFERLLDTLQPAKEAVNGAFDIYVSHMSHRTNQVIKTLTMVSTVLLPTTVIISLFGTNLAGLNQYGPLEFLLMLCCILLTVVATLWVFRRRGWL